MFDKFLTNFRLFGVVGGLIYTLDRLLSRLSTKSKLYYYELMVQPIHNSPLLPESLSKSLTLKEIYRGDPEILHMPRPSELIDFRFDQGARCLGLYQDKDFIGYMWFSAGSYLEDEVRCHYVLDPALESVFDFDIFLFPEHRMGLGFVGMWNEVNKFLCKANIHYTFSRLTRFNLPSRQAHVHLGWKRLGQALFLQLGSVEFMFATVSPYVSLTFKPSQRVKLQLNADVLLS